MTPAIDLGRDAYGDLHALHHAFEVFTDATARLEREYGTLQTRLAALTTELEEKNRLLADSLVCGRMVCHAAAASSSSGAFSARQPSSDALSG